MQSVLIAFLFTLIAGLATGIGSIIALAAKRTNYRFLSISTGFSAGVMIYVSFIELFQEGIEGFHATFPAKEAYIYTTISFFVGILLIALIDFLIPSEENPHELPSSETIAKIKTQPDSDAQKKLHRMGLLTALAIGIHNFPEGAATFFSALEDPKIGFAIMFAIALHNIPEGVSVSVPIFYATGSRRKAFIYSFLSGLAEPIGALIAYVILIMAIGQSGQNIPPALTGAIFAAVAGIMVYISLDELLPTSRAYGKGHDCLIGLISGMIIMALSLIMTM